MSKTNNINEKKNMIDTIIPLLLNSKLKSEYLDNGVINDFNEIHLYFKNDLKCVEGLYIVDIDTYFENAKLSEITKKLYFFGEITYENEFNKKKKLIIGEINYFHQRYFYCIIQKENLFWINNYIPEYTIYIAGTFKTLLYRCLSFKELKSLDSWFKSRITGYITDDLTESFKINDNFLTYYHITFKLVQLLYIDYKEKKEKYCLLNNKQYNETFNEILKKNNIIPNNNTFQNYK